MTPRHLSHYEVLGVARTASATEIKSAYRSAARRHHPDAVSAQRSGPVDGDRMASLNEAWRVLGDERRRREYDLLLDDIAGTSSPRPAASSTPPTPTIPPRRNPLSRYLDEPRLPWKPMLVAAALGSVAVLLAAARAPATPLRPVDGRLMPDECVMLDIDGSAVETLCDGSHDGVADTIVVDPLSCPQQTQPHLDRSGGGVACVRV